MTAPLDLFLRAHKIALCVVRQWWRPLTCAGIAGSLVVNGVAVPLMTGMGADLTGLAALVAALTPFVAARSWEKSKGLGDAGG